MPRALRRAESPGRRPAATLTVLLASAALVVVIVHWPALGARARTFDDHMYLVNNPLVQNPGWASTARFFTEILAPSTVDGYYQPLAMISLMLDHARGGSVGDLRPFHQTSLLLHAANTALVGLLLYLLFRQPWVAALVALLFGIHPQTVEPIPWVSERKTLLATFFALISLNLYVLHARRPRWTLVAGYLAAFVLAVLSKPTSTPLPLVMLLLDYWPLRRLSWRRVLEKTPLFVIAAAASLVTVISQGQRALLELPHEQSPLRIPLTLCHNIVFYLAKATWPAGLTPHYPLPAPFDLTHPALRVGVIGTVTLLALLLLSWRWTRALLTGWLIFFVALFPTLGVIGFTNVIASDKYVYLPAVGLLLVLAWGLGRLWDRSPHDARGRWTRAAIIAGTVLLLVFEARGVRRQLTHWQDTEGLYRYMLTQAPNSVSLHSELGTELAERGRHEEAMAHFQAALQMNPDSYMVHNNMATMLLQQGRCDEAITHFETALRLNPDVAAATYNNIGWAHWQAGRPAQAITCFERALALNPRLPEAHASLGFVMSSRGDWNQAVAHYEQALRFKPDSADAHLGIGNALGRLGRIPEAESHFRAAVRLQPSDPGARNNLAQVLLMQGRLDEAIRTYEDALRIAPADQRAQAGLARARAARAGAAAVPP